MIRIDASNVIPKRLGTYLLGIIPGLVFELRVSNKTLFYGAPPESAVNLAVAQPGKELQSLGFTMHPVVCQQSSRLRS